MSSTGLSNATLTALYDVNIANSLGWYLSTVLADESAMWGCVESNCAVTDNVITNQWGSSSVTNVPLYTAMANDYIPISWSMASWGTTYPTPGVSMPPEVYAYMQAPYNPTGAGAFTITPTIMNMMFQTDYSWFGFQNIYNSMQLMVDFKNYNNAVN